MVFKYYQKSSIIGVGVDNYETNRLASGIGCKVESLPFKYLGVPIGGRSSTVAFWEPIFNKFRKRLSNWKANLLSIGGRATLISSVLGSLGIYFLSLFRMPKKVNNELEALRSSFFWGGQNHKQKIAWVKWRDVVVSKDDGGVGFGILDAMNQALLYKWRWRAVSNPESIWVRVLSSIHGEACFIKLTAKSSGVWSRIAKTIRDVHYIPSFHNNVIKRKVGNGQNTKFWKDTWCGDNTLADSFPRLFALDLENNCTISERRNNNNWQWNWRRPLREGRELTSLQAMISILSVEMNMEDVDKWVWNLDGKTEFYVAQIRQKIDHQRHNNVIVKKTLWNSLVPKKVNLFVWRMRKNCLPTNINLFARGIGVNSFRCLHCNMGVEDTNHLFQNCSLANGTRNLLSSWINLDIPNATPDEVLKWCDGLKLSCRVRNKIHALLLSWWWHLWKARNSIVHNNMRETCDEMFNSMVSLTYLWINNRDKKSTSCNDAWKI